MHRSVHRSKKFLDSVTSAHTQGIERAWLDEKSWDYRARGNGVDLRSHFNEATWSILRELTQSDSSLVNTFLEDI